MAHPDRHCSIAHPDGSLIHKLKHFGRAALILAAIGVGKYLAPVVITGIAHIADNPPVRYETYQTGFHYLSLSGFCYPGSDENSIPYLRADKVKVFVNPQGLQVQQMPNWPCN